MGKDKAPKGGGAKGGGGAAAAAARCTCEHPFQCSCGNRPERPSKGHKWYGDIQQWAGKGHKQKGASGQTASVAEKAKVTDSAVVVAQWQRLPEQILHEYCQRQKRPLPVYKELKNANGDTAANANDAAATTAAAAANDKTATAASSKQQQRHLKKYRVILRDPKNNATKDLIFIPKHGVVNAEQAKQEAALLALLQLTPNLPHEQKLPEPYRTTWLNAVAAATTKTTKADQQENAAEVTTTTISTTTMTTTTTTMTTPVPKTNVATASQTLELANRYVSDAERAQQTAAANAVRQQAQRRRDNILSANQNYKVHLSETLRKEIECLLLKEDHNNDHDDDDENVLPDGIRAQLAQSGFTQGQIDQARGDSLEECLQSLLLRLPEDELPEQYDPRGQTLDVVVAPGSNNVHLATVLQYGLSKPEGLRVIKMAQQKSGSSTTMTMTATIRTVLWDMMCAMAGYNGATALSTTTTTTDDDGQRTDATEKLAEELEALQSIFETDLVVTEQEEDELHIVIANQVEFTVSRGCYPITARPDRIFIRQASTALHVALIRQLADIPLGEAMLFELHGAVKELLDDMDSLPKVSLLDHQHHDGPNNKSETDSTRSNNKPGPSSNAAARLSSKSLRPPRTRVSSPFWSVSPEKTKAAPPPASSSSMATVRQQLPAAASRAAFLSAVRNHRVVLVTGETGSGKSTQLPAYILEDSPGSVKIVVAQPRRLAATGVATRVAQERGENVGQANCSIGYIVRGDTAMNDASTRLVFCTTGILLRQLQNETALSNITHIVIDEVHERNLDSDVLLGILKERLDEYPQLRVILMSATLDQDKFAKYWGVLPPHIHIPGRTFPVQDFMLEDVLKITGYMPRKNRNNNGRGGGNGNAWSESDAGDEEDEQDAASQQGAPAVDDDDVLPDGLPMSELLKRVDETKVDYDMLSALVVHLVRQRTADDDGSILIFLAGVPEISKGIDALRRSCKDWPVILLPLHGGLQPKEQNSVFRKPDKGKTKIILSTNVAETSVTIPDCTIVVDTCREKQSSFDPVNRMPMLVEQFASKASLKQRRGRAGRVREGTCYKLISRRTFDKLAGHAEPEIRRVALDQTLLQLMFLGIDDGTGSFMKKLLDPPRQASLDAAALSLEKLGAVTRSSDLSCGYVMTPLGTHLAAIPSPPIVGKLIVMGSILGCQNAALAMAAGISAGRSPLLRIEKPWRHRNSEVSEREMIEDDRIDRILKERAKISKRVGKSDHAFLAEMFMGWKSSPERKKFCDSLGLSFTGMQDMMQLHNQLEASLATAGFVATKQSERNSTSWRIIHSCAVTAMAPGQLVKIRRPPEKYHDTAEGAVKKSGEAKELKFFIRVDADGSSTTATPDNSSKTSHQEERVFIHPSSVNFTQGDYSFPFLVYNSLVRTSKPFLRDVTECNAYAMLLFGRPLELQASKDTIVIDSWASLSANARIGVLIKGLRRRLDKLLEEKIRSPDLDIASAPEMDIIAKLISTDGFGVSTKSPSR